MIVKDVLVQTIGPNFTGKAVCFIFLFDAFFSNIFHFFILGEFCSNWNYKWLRLHAPYNSYRNSQQDATVYQNLLFHVYMKLNMFRATHRPSSRAQNYTSSLWFCVRGGLLDVEVAGHGQLTTSSKLNVHQPSTYAKPEAASAVLSSWWWAMCRPKHVELHINME